MLRPPALLRGSFLGLLVASSLAGLESAFGAVAEAAAAQASGGSPLDAVVVGPFELEEGRDEGKQSDRGDAAAQAKGDDDEKEDAEKNEDAAIDDEKKSGGAEPKKDEGEKKSGDQEEAKPAEAPAAQSGVLRHIAKELKAQLDSNAHQGLVALLAAAFGLVMLFDGEDAFNFVLVAACFLLVSALAMGEVANAWGVGRHSLVSQVVGLEAGVVAAYAAFRSLPGLIIGVGAVCGAAVGVGMQHLLVAHGAVALAENKGLIVAYYSGVVFLGAALFSCGKHAKLLALASAAGGSLLTSAAISWAVTAKAAQFFPDATPKTGMWLDFLLLLVKEDAADVGLFADAVFNIHFRGQAFRRDRVLGLVIAAALFLVGSAVQLRSIRRRAGYARERIGLEEALLSPA